MLWIFVLKLSLMETISDAIKGDNFRKEAQRKSWFKFGRKFWVLLVVIDVFILFVIYYFFFNGKSDSQSVSPIARIAETFEDPQKISPTPFPFQDLTIPHLRAQKFESKFGELVMQSEAADSLYSSFLTSFQSDGLRINGLLTKPNGEMPVGGFPAIIFIHGYIPPAQYATLGPQYADYVDYLARSGFVVFKIDLRGHGDSEGEAGGAYYSADYVVDTLNAYSALQNADFVNPDSVGLWGHSMAGNVVLRSMAVKPQIPAGVIWAGAVYTYEDMSKYGIQDSSFDRSMLTGERGRRRAEMRNLYGEPNLSNEFWAQVAPVSYLNEMTGALQINHAVDDNVVNIGYAHDLKKYLEEENVKHEFIEYPSGGHNITGASFVSAMENTVEFYNQHLSIN